MNKKIFIALGAVVLILAVGGYAYSQQQAAAAAEALAKQEAEDLRVAMVLEESDKLSRGYYYDEAMAILNEEITTLVEGGAILAEEAATSEDSEEVEESANLRMLTSQLGEIETAKNSLVKYEGPIHHVFFHSLIVYPELAFDDKGHPAQGYNMWMTTVLEFQRMLPLLMERGFVLYDLREYIEEDPADPTKVKLKDIMLPEGKIPLVISVDDVNYYKYMEPDGFADRLVLGDDGRVYTEVKKDGEVMVTRDGDVVPILDDFVEEHPEFSWRGAKGTLAVTGYEGALGYLVDDDTSPEDLVSITAEAKAVADELKETGWTFACHSYTHNGYFREKTITMDQINYDTTKWKKYIEPIVGETNLYISPFGVLFSKDDPRYRYLIDQGFNIYCPVGNGKRITYNGDNITMPRINLDGYKMIYGGDEITEYYFDVDEVLDSARPPLIL